jgi:hypothetical protein
MSMKTDLKDYLSEMETLYRIFKGYMSILSSIIWFQAGWIGMKNLSVLQ